MAVEISLRVTKENVHTIFLKGDVIVGAEDLGTVRSARNTIHNNGTAFVYFDVAKPVGDYTKDVVKEMFGVPQTLVVLRDEDKVGRVARVLNCRVCDTEVVLEIDPVDETAWKAGKFVQHAFPYLTAAERELLVSGTCGPCFDRMFGDEDED